MEPTKKRKQETLQLAFKNLKERITEKKQWDKKSVNLLFSFMEETLKLFEDHETRLDEIQNLQPEKDDEEAFSISLGKNSDGEEDQESEKSQDDEPENSDDKEFIDDENEIQNPKKLKKQKPI